MTFRYVVPALLALTIGAATVDQATAQTRTTPPNTTTNPGTTTTPGTPPSNTGTSMTTAPVPSAPTSGADNNAVITSPQNNPGAPVPGANSFTEGQAKSRISDQGFSQISDLKLDGQGVWRGKAMRDGKGVEVTMDYQGNIVAK